MERKDERGTISAVGLCAALTAVMLGAALAQFVSGGASVSSEYEREMQLRLAAESGVETAAAQLERTADAFGAVPEAGAHKEVDAGIVPMAEHIELHVYIETPQGADGFLDVGAAAVDLGGTRIPDGEGWTRAKIVRARMERRGDRYVWRRWF